MARTDRITTMSANGPPPQAAAVLYPGKVMHHRLKPFGNRFAYTVFSLLVDIDRLDEVGRMSRLLSANRTNLFSFWEMDHAEHDGETLRAHADRLLAGAGLEKPAARILLLAYPRILGYAFNPISVYFAYDEDDTPIALIYAVRNTFGERHTYVAPVADGDLSEAGIRQTRTKIFHVSPFIDMGTRCNFRILPPGRTIRPPGRTIRLRIHEAEKGEALLSATFTGDAKKLGTAALSACLLKFPLMTWKIVAGIHWEALKLWLRGARFHRSPPPPEPVSYRDEGGAFEAGE